MDFFENLGSKLSKAGSGASQKFKKMQNASALGSQISRLEKSINELYCNLGSQYYSRYANDPRAEFASFCNSISQLKSQIESANEELRILRATTVCQNCGANLKEGSSFCPACGSRVPQITPVQNKTCSTCGAALDPESDFCAQCGTRVGADTPPPVQGNTVCPECGRKLRQDASFCPGCGYKF